MELKPGYKQTEIGVLPEDWDVTELGTLISSVQLGGNYPNQSGQTNYPLMKMGNIARGYIDLSKIEYVSGGNKPLEEHRLVRGDILFNTRNTLDLVGKVAIWNNEIKEAYFNSNLMRIKFDPLKIFSNRFINYFFNTKNIISQLRLIATGTTSVAAIYFRDLEKISFAIPPRFEQKAIASALSDVDALLDSLDALIAKKRDMKKAAMQELLTGKTRLPGFSGEWKAFELGKEGSLQKETINPQQISNVLVDEFSMPAFDEGRRPQRVLGETMHSNRTRINGPVLLFNKLNVRQKRVWLVPKTNENSVCSMEFLAYQTSRLDLELLRHILLTEEVTSFFESCSTGTSNSQKRITPSTFLEYEVNLPTDLSEQQAIANVLSDMDAELEALEARYAKVKGIKTGMMQELLTGKTRLVPTGEQHG